MRKPSLRRSDTPLARVLKGRGWRLSEFCAVSGLSLWAARKVLALDPRCSVEWLLRAAYALGCAPSELWPGLDYKPARPVRLADEAVVAALTGERLTVATVERASS